jgi:hypothetical protein
MIPLSWRRFATTGVGRAPAEITAALTGHYRPELLFALQQTLDSSSDHQIQLSD